MSCRVVTTVSWSHAAKLVPDVLRNNKNMYHAVFEQLGFVPHLDKGRPAYIGCMNWSKLGPLHEHMITSYRVSMPGSVGENLRDNRPVSQHLLREQARANRKAEKRASGTSGAGAKGSALKKARRTSPWHVGGGALKQIVLDQIRKMTVCWTDPAYTPAVNFLKLNFPRAFDNKDAGRVLNRSNALSWFNSDDITADGRVNNSFSNSTCSQVGNRRKVPAELKKELLGLMNVLSRSSAEVNAVALHPVIKGYVLSAASLTAQSNPLPWTRVHMPARRGRRRALSACRSR